MTRWRFAAALALFPLASAGAQSPPASADVTAIRAGRLVVGDGRVIEHPVVIVQGETITAVGPSGSVTIPKGARVIDLGERTLLPGLIDTHTHINSFDSDGGDSAILKETPAHAGVYGAVNAKKTIDAGFTTIRDVGAVNFADVAVRDLVARGVIPGPRMYVAGPSLGIVGGHADVNGFNPSIPIPGTGVMVTGVDEVRRAVRTNIKFGADHIKITATGGILSQGDAPSASQFADDELRAAVEEAARLGRKVAAHAHGARGVIAAVNAGVASIEHGSLIDDEGIALMKARGVYLVPTLIILEEIVRLGAAKGYPDYAIAKAKRIEPERRVRLRKAFQSGVKFAFGTDATGDIHGRNAQEFSLLVDQLGATPAEAIRMATVNAADLIGIGDRTGTIEVGKWADLIAVNGNPLEDIRRLEQVSFVMKAGRVYKEAAAR